MESRKLLVVLVLGMSLMLCISTNSPAEPMGTAFTYQGRFIDSNSPADGTYDFEYKLYDDFTGGTQLGNTIYKENLEVIDGYFTTELDFGSGVFDGDARWLGIGVRPGESTDDYTTLNPRQELTPTPYTIYTGDTAHDAVTLDDDANNILTLTGQEIGLTEAFIYNETYEQFIITGSNCPLGIKSGSAAIYPDRIWVKVETYEGKAAYIGVRDSDKGFVQAPEGGYFQVEAYGGTSLEDLHALNFFTINDGNSIEWNTAYGWGDHASQNYLDLDDYPDTDTDSTDDGDMLKSTYDVADDGFIDGNDTAYDPTSWDGNLNAPTMNAVRDEIESLVLGGGGGMTPSVYTGQESVAYTNGLIEKFGYKTRTASLITLSFNEAFPNAIISLTVTPVSSNERNVTYAPTLSNVNVNGAKIRDIDNDIDGYYWIAKGY